MSDPSLLSQFKFTERQRQAVTRRSRTIAVVAGAGSGKTRVLVGRYLHLLEKGYPLRSLAAITFTEKAAREMRSRIRAAIEERLAAQSTPSDTWSSALTDLDAARIGTIHSLCAEILRAHPAEAGVDPGFAVVDEGQAAALQAQSVEAALAWAATQAETAPLFGALTENGLRRVLATLLARRLDAQPALDASRSDEWPAHLGRWLDARLNAANWIEALRALSGVRAHKDSDKLEQARLDVLAHVETVRAARAAEDWDAAFEALALLRRAISTGGQKGNWDEGDLALAREAMSALRDHFDAELAPLVGKDGAVRWSLDRQAADLIASLRLVFAHALDAYQHLKGERQALDFDDLEGGAARLLSERPDVGERWRADLRAVLVDEFQDTNPRQRQIVYALTGFNTENAAHAGDLFVVGDAKQSIYKFRGADVSVFRRVQADIAASGGLSVDLDLTFRAHRSLLDAVNALLAPILGEVDDPARPYQVPFAPLRAYRKAPALETLRAPYVELHLGLGDDAETGRLAAAAALADRLRDLSANEGVAWGDVALLFRSSSNFDVYEDALERAGIPFVTVAGRGFYDRPEIRDVLNALAAIADPTDDLALAGLLRSPAIGLSDADLYRLRWGDGDQPQSLSEKSLNPPPSHQGTNDHQENLGVSRRLGDSVVSFQTVSQPLWDALNASQERSAREDIARACSIIAELHALSGRVSAAAILKRFLDLTGYRAILAGAPQGRRLRRNVDKLLADAHRSRLVGLGEFLEYVQSLRDVGVREGEAPVDPSAGSGGGAAQLMTVHKAKGLEFPVVVIADAAYEHRGGGETALVDESLGLLIGLSDGPLRSATPSATLPPSLRYEGGRGRSRASSARPTMWRLASLDEAAKEEAEDARLLYVAATRAKEKLIVSGHVKLSAKGALALRGWLARLGSVIGLEEIVVEAETSEPRTLDVRIPGEAGSLVCVLHPPRAATTVPFSGLPSAEPLPAPISIADLVAPISADLVDTVNLQSAIRDQQSRVWRVVPRAKRPGGPAWVVGKLVHEALRRWRFPSAGNFDVFLWPFALEAGLTDAAEIQATLDEARRLLTRFQAHPLCAEIGAAARYHEVPYALAGDSGIVDLLYRAEAGWTIVDFKTDELRSLDEMRETIRREGYDAQVLRYVDALAAQLGQRPRARLAFLNVAGEVQVMELEVF
jgi:ATP-dependent helicase/nuclease subunit A